VGAEARVLAVAQGVGIVEGVEDSRFLTGRFARFGMTKLLKSSVANEY
jgi:hypothetical protein